MQRRCPTWPRRRCLSLGQGVHSDQVCQLEKMQTLLPAPSGVQLSPKEGDWKELGACPPEPASELGVAAGGKLGGKFWCLFSKG